MWRFALHRTAQTIPLLLLLSVLVFSLFRAIPGDYLSEMQLNPLVPPETVDQLREQYGFDRSLASQYFHWLRSAITGDFGYSFAQRRPAAELIVDRLVKTLTLAGSAFGLTLALALPLGVWAAFREGQWPDRVILALSLSGLSLPTLLASLGLLWFAFRTGWFPLVADAPGGLILPTVTLAVPATAFLVRTLRMEVIDTLRLPFIRALSARGLPQRRILWHALRNSANPIISLLGVVLGSFLGGAVIVEKIFQWPGLGALAVDSILSRDLFVAVNTLLVGACLTVAANLAADFLLAWNDPRVRAR